MSEPELLVEIRDGVGHLTLNRPRAINALTRAMIVELDEVLQRWCTDDAVERVELHGSGERGFCSGADVRALRSQVLTDPDEAIGFFTDEYRVDALLASYPKPVTAHMHGITMGGGLGLSLHVPQRIATATTQLAMPETTIGLFPDVGALFELSRLPGETGTYLAMTGRSVDAASALWAGLVTEVAGDGEVPPQGVASEVCELARWQPWIDTCFSGDDPEAIVAGLENHDDPEARETGALIRTKSPLSVAVALEAIRRAAGLDTVADVLAQDLVLARHFVANPDFVEGVRAQLVDKDRNPQWRHASLAEVTRDEVLAFFD